MPLRTSDRRNWITRSCLASLTLATSLADLGCSHLRSRLQKASHEPAVLGESLPNRDIYAGRQDQPANPTAIATRTSQTEPTSPPVEPVVLQPPVGVEASPTLAKSNPASVIDPTPSPTQIVAAARATLETMATYQLALKRQERVNGQLLPAEDLTMAIRRHPRAARLTWADGPHRGREVLYRADEPGGMMHVNMADSKLPIPRLTLAPDSPMVMKNSRHPITEAGLDPIIASLEEAAQTGTLVDLGMETPPPLANPHHGLMRTTSEGDVWHVYLDPGTSLPAVVECRAANGDLLEHYLFQNIQANPVDLASNDAFTPDARWGAPKGLFGRMTARSNDSATR